MNVERLDTSHCRLHVTAGLEPRTMVRSLLAAAWVPKRRAGSLAAAHAAHCHALLLRGGARGRVSTQIVTGENVLSLEVVLDFGDQLTCAQRRSVLYADTKLE